MIFVYLTVSSKFVNSSFQTDVISLSFIVNKYYFQDLISVVVKLSTVVFKTVVPSSVLDYRHCGGIFSILFNLTLSAK
jgi:hypothetical protein